jgi:phage gpG-like protein
MIKPKIKYRLPKLTTKQKALKAVITPIARDTKNKVRAAVPTKSKALKGSINYKITSKKGNARAIIGVQSKYSKIVKTGKNAYEMKIPNQYGLAQELRFKFLVKNINMQLVERLKQAAKAKLNELITEGR